MDRFLERSSTSDQSSTVLRHFTRPHYMRSPPQLRGLLAAEFSSQKFLVKRGKPEFSYLRSIVLILNRPPVVQ